MPTNELKLSPEMLLWKQLGITSCTMEFSCGGDSMNDTSFHFYKPNNKKGKNQPAVIEVDCQELETYFDNEVYKNVNFYEASDGHYQGEFGSVEILLDEDDEDEPEFTYSKSAQSEFCERTTNVIGITLKKKEIEFIKNYVSNINGGEGNIVVNYKKDFIITDELESIKNDIEKKIDVEVSEYSPEVDGELDEWYSYTTNGEELNEPTIKGNELQLEVSNSFTSIVDSED